MTRHRRGGSVTMSPSVTPKSSEKWGRDLRSTENGSASKHDKDKGVNIQVLLRCRPLSEDELRVNTPVVISCNELRREVTAIQNIANKQIDRTFAFDKVFGPTSQQKDLFDAAVSPVVNEVLEGYNCTIFAYGQTGTGKTYTMEGGGRKMKNGKLPSDAGVIPRAVQRIFDILEAQSADYNMKVTFLELYNEEITDLLAMEESKLPDDKSRKPIALMEDGKGGVLVRGLEEEIVSSAGEIYKILDKGSAKRRTAETLLNKQSSRSHSIFSITIHIKECTPEGEEMIRCGKLNLVDLAGSENISRSGAKEGRAREAGEINKSLLTLGRIIMLLDSKLTRLLRDSLGGKTKTCIIATISPSIYCLEETLSTLDYAHRAKNIKNKPEINQKMMKSALMKDLYSEIDRLKQEVYAAREKNGVYIPRDHYLLEEAEKKAMAEKMERLELDLESKEKKLIGLEELYDSQLLLTSELSGKLEKSQKKLEVTEHALCDLEGRYKQANSLIKEKEYLISNLLKSEKALVERTYDLRSELEKTASDVSGLFSKIERKDKIEDGNKILVQKFQSQLIRQLDMLHKTVSDSVMQHETHLQEMEEEMRSFVSTKSEATEELRGRVKKLQTMFCSGIRTLDDLASELDKKSQSTCEKLNSQVHLHSSALDDSFKDIVAEAEQLINELQNGLIKQEDKLAAFAQRQQEGHLRAMETTRSIAKIVASFFHILDVHDSNLNKILKEAQVIHDQQLSQLEKRFEECAADEERQLLEKVAEMLAGSNARKKILVQTTVDGLREAAAERTSSLQKEMSTAREFTLSVKEQWSVHMKETENNYKDGIAAVESSKCSMEEGFRQCLAKARMGSEQWQNAQSSLVSLGKENLSSVESIIRSATEANQELQSRLSSAVSTTLEDVDVANKAILSSMQCSLKLDHDACANVDFIIAPAREQLRELKVGHNHKIMELSENAGKCLVDEYMVDEPTCSTPKKRAINLPSMTSIEELITPPFEELLKSFWEAKSPSKPTNGDAKHYLHTNDTSRAPLSAIN
ncbi:Plus-end-directed kinesin ATPase protein [Dioscorea alata]|uniref:Plus-end-directed kinesin ATPase protein n=1 Tax=Dioscorea alata TaxID=55571 RepID=A0ACB7V315_DIOAL|nr:Plus-end-directed kinesin ATPase protein [Dioscorea alata]